MGNETRFVQMTDYAIKTKDYSKGQWVWTCKVCEKKITGGQSCVAEHFYTDDLDVQGVKKTTNVARCPEGKNDDLRSKAIKYVKDTLAKAKKLAEGSASGSQPPDMESQACASTTSGPTNV
jgi:hypothetical protein